MSIAGHYPEARLPAATSSIVQMALDKHVQSRDRRATRS
jgi:hypothetical protein